MYTCTQSMITDGFCEQTEDQRVVMGNKNDRPSRRRVAGLNPPRTLSEKGLKLYSTALSISRDVAEKRSERYKDTESEISDQIRSCESKWEFVGCLMKFREELSHIRLDAPTPVSKKQIEADLTREIFVLDGEKFDAHAKGRGNVKILIEKLKDVFVEHDAHMKYLYIQGHPQGVDLTHPDYEGWLKVKTSLGFSTRRVVLDRSGNCSLHKGSKGLDLDESFNLNEMNPLPSPRLRKSLLGSHQGLDVALEYKSQNRRKRSDSNTELTLWHKDEKELERFSGAIKKIASQMKDLKTEVRKSAILQMEIDNVLQALSRTNSGGDPFSKIMSLFPVTGAERYFIRARKKVIKHTQVHVSRTHIVVTTYNTFDVQFTDENHSPIEEGKLEVNTVLMEIVTFGTTPKTTSRYLEIEMPDVETVGDIMDVLGVVGDD